MNSAPQIQSVEIADTELDGVSGGTPHLDLSLGEPLFGSALVARAEGTEVSVDGTALGAFGHLCAGL